jgi:hypothetical protein
VRVWQGGLVAHLWLSCGVVQYTPTPAEQQRRPWAHDGHRGTSRLGATKRCAPQSGGLCPGFTFTLRRRGQGQSPHHRKALSELSSTCSLCVICTAGACMHGACSQLLLLLVDYLRILHRTTLADTACFMLGGALARQEHMLRSTRVEHWPWEAVQHMDALVQLYAQLLQQVRPVHGVCVCVCVCVEGGICYGQLYLQ